MGDLRGEGVSVGLPRGWEGRARGRGSTLLQAASFPLPATTADFGGGAVDVMQAKDVLVILFEYSAASVGTPLFAAEGVPTLTADDFRPDRLRKMIDGQSAAQKFFTAAGRAFCLYIVLGSHGRRLRTLPLVNTMLASLAIER